MYALGFANVLFEEPGLPERLQRRWTRGMRRVMFCQRHEAPWWTYGRISENVGGLLYKAEPVPQFGLSPDGKVFLSYVYFPVAVSRYPGEATRWQKGLTGRPRRQSITAGWPGGKSGKGCAKSREANVVTQLPFLFWIHSGSPAHGLVQPTRRVA